MRHESSLESLKKLCTEGRLDEALKAVDDYKHGGVLVSSSILYSLLQGCINKKDLKAGKEVHCLVKKCQLESNAFLGSHLIRLFDICESLSEAKRVFTRVLEPNVFAWSAIISAHAKVGEGEGAIELYHQMLQSSVKPDKYVFIAVLKACASVSALRQGRLIHIRIIESGIQYDMFLTSILIDLYAKCRSIEDADTVFDGIHHRDVVLWNAMITGQAQHGHSRKALGLYRQMQQEGILPNDATIVSILKVCSSSVLLDQGEIIHTCILESGFGLELVVGNTLIHMYAKCGSLENARRVFDESLKRDVVTWNAMIAGYAQHGLCQEAFLLFQKMQRAGVGPNNVTWNSVIAGYVKHGHCQEALLLLQRMQQEGMEPDIVTFNALIAGLAQHDHGEDALHLFKQMQKTGLVPDNVTFISILKACSNLAALDQGKQTHAYISESGLEGDMFVASAIIDMYAKCGKLDCAYAVFNKMKRQNVVTWSAMIAGYAQHGNYKLALQCFEDMQLEGLKPNEVTFVSIISACSHMGLVGEGNRHFTLMCEHHGIKPTFEHYNCMIDLLGGAGYLLEAEQLLRTIPFQPNLVGWTSLLSHCRKHGNVKIGRQCFDQLVKMDSRRASWYIIMSNIFSDAGMWEDAKQMLARQNAAFAQKAPGKAFIEIDNKANDFIVGDRSHPRSEAIYGKLKHIDVQMREQGYVPHLDLVWQRSY